MTVTLAYVDTENKCTYIGADSCASDSCSYSLIKNPKVFNPVGRKDILIGGAGTLRLLNLLENIEGIFPPETEVLTDEINLSYLVNNFIPILSALTEDFGENDIWDLLLAVGTRLYRVQYDLSVIESVDNADAIGVGGSVALGALKVLNELKPDMSIEDRISYALNVACSSCNGCMPPFNIRKTEVIPDDIVNKVKESKKEASTKNSKSNKVKKKRKIQNT